MNKPDIDLLLNVLGKYDLTPIVLLGIKFLLRNPFESLIVVDQEAKIQFMDRGSEKFFGLSQGKAKGVDIRNLIPESGHPIAIQTGVPLVGRIFNVKDKKRIGSVYPLIHNGKVVGAISRLLFHSLEEVEQINKEVIILKNEIDYLKQREQNEYSARYTFQDILGNSSLIRDTIDFAKKISLVDTDVLLVGESGTGKELFAHSIHSLTFGKKPFVKVNCPAIPFDLAESELFGYEKGAFSGASSSGKPGKFEMANNGTIFLDEISSLSLSIQAKLLRVLQEREIERLGSTKTEKIRFKLIAATNIDLRSLVKEGKFREDLYYRISKAVINVPPLRDRREDIPLYISHFMEKINQSFKTNIKSLSTRAMSVLTSYSWPGNVRELINILDQAMLKGWSTDQILYEHLPLEMVSSKPNRPEALLNNDYTANIRPEGFKEEIGAKEKQLIIDAIKNTNGNRRKAAVLLGMPRSTLYAKIKRYRIAVD